MLHATNAVLELFGGLHFNVGYFHYAAFLTWKDLVRQTNLPSNAYYLLNNAKAEVSRIFM